MSTKKYDESDLERVGAAVAEHLADKMDVFFENFDVILEEKISPLRKDVAGLKTEVKLVKEDIADLKTEVKLVKKAVSGTNKELRHLDKAVGNVEHRVDRNSRLTEARIFEAQDQYKALATIVDTFSARLDRMET